MICYLDASTGMQKACPKAGRKSYGLVEGAWIEQKPREPCFFRLAVSAILVQQQPVAFLCILFPREHGINSFAIAHNDCIPAQSDAETCLPESFSVLRCIQRAGLAVSHQNEILLPLKRAEVIPKVRAAIPNKRT